MGVVDLALEADDLRRVVALPVGEQPAGHGALGDGVRRQRIAVVVDAVAGDLRHAGVDQRILVVAVLVGGESVAVLIDAGESRALGGVDAAVGSALQKARGEAERAASVAPEIVAVALLGVAVGPAVAAEL